MERTAKGAAGETCATCRFWRWGAELAANVVEVGQCRKHPPRIMETSMKGDTGLMEVFDATAFPVVADDEWCGEYQRLAPKGLG